MNNIKQKDSNSHEIKRLEFGDPFGIQYSDISRLFGKSPDKSLELLPIYKARWDDIEPLVNWIINNTEYKVININEIYPEKYTYRCIVYFMK